MAPPSIQAGRHRVELRGDCGTFAARFQTERVAPDVHLVTLELTAATPAHLPQVELAFMHPAIDIQSMWTTGACRNRGLAATWCQPFISRVASEARSEEHTSE